MKKEAIITIDIGASKIRLQPVDKDGNSPSDGGQIISVSLVELNLNNEGFMNLIVENIHKTINALNETKVLAISIGSPGPLDTLKGIIEETPNLKGVKNLNIVDQLSKKFPGLPVYLLNDADAAGLGEWWLGSGRGARSFIYITLSTGVGSAFVLDGKLERGLGKASEWGHTSLAVENNPRLCSCGHWSCPEAYLGTNGLAITYAKIFNVKVADLDEKTKYSISFKLREGLKRKDPLWFRVLDEYTKNLAELLRSIIKVHQPNAITLGGGIAFGNNELLKLTKEKLKKLMSLKKDESEVTFDGVWIHLANFENAVNLGAAKYALEQLER